MHNVAAVEEPVVKEKQKADTKKKPKRQPPYAVVLHNDPVNGFDFVVSVLRKIFKYSTPKAFMLTMRAHVSGRSIVWTGTLELAELKADQIRSCGPDPVQASSGACSLSVSLEPLPSE